ncbi:MAG: bifunctional phosphopantothenoylcysteine decarboxylase/phosphopantothenate--cysteine ligase CoaBC, partial [Hydrogenovibrio sp.]|nr:bifunctional phosphopantothenoylcysteine decarboxylase/phosphopantothenate--cysteine ligase CoaBC [Hydrogenovibrio sp.]
ELARWPDLIVIAPASAETLAKLRMGRADDLLTTLCLATEKPILIAPAMNRLMWANAATQENVSILQDRGMEIIAPDKGEQACGEVGAGRMPDPKALYEKAIAYAEQQLDDSPDAPAWQILAEALQGKTLLVSAGPTHEPIDPVRFIGNRSSGKMGFAIAEVAAKLGAKVTLIAGPVALPTPAHVERLNVKSAEQMFEAVKSHYASADYFISAAAVADFRMSETAVQKLKKQAGQATLTLELIKNPDIIAWVAQQADKPVVVGFAAETENVIDYAKQKLARKGLDMICANEVGEAKGFERNDNALTLITAEEYKPLVRSNKRHQAYELLRFLVQHFPC